MLLNAVNVILLEKSPIGKCYRLRADYARKENVKNELVGDLMNFRHLLSSLGAHSIPGTRTSSLANGRIVAPFERESLF
ncbi:protein of unknown function [Methylocaldum szegediense]|uniref:Uncharacterized protein n=1 Tax=Methylocaldum szegediense TaxID=73780 RepID=A0ABN8X765_9GAMM|nr:protein of unknown function [Methylocaldum szegediense]